MTDDANECVVVAVCGFKKPDFVFSRSRNMVNPSALFFTAVKNLFAILLHHSTNIFYDPILLMQNKMIWRGETRFNT